MTQFSCVIPVKVENQNIFPILSWIPFFNGMTFFTLLILRIDISSSFSKFFVIPAEAGNPDNFSIFSWIPFFNGMTGFCG